MTAVPASSGHERGPVVVNTVSGARGDYADWVAAFTALWQAGKPRAGEFMDIMSPHIRLMAPGLRTTSGREACQEAFRLAFLVLPDLTATVQRWSAAEETLFIEMTFSATIGGHPVQWRNVDRFLFKDGQAIERVAFYNPAKVRGAFLRNPLGWLQLLRRVRSGL